MTRKPAFCLVAVILACPVSLTIGQDAKPTGGAEQLFRKMEERLEKAKTLECTFEIKGDVQAPGDPRTDLLLEGSLFLADGNRVREEIRDSINGHPLFRLLVSDGRRWWWHDKGSPPHLVEEKPGDSLKSDFLTLLARPGLYLPTLPLPPVEVADIKERFPVSHFRVGPKEKIGGREAQRLEYQFEIKGQKGPAGEDWPFSVTVWLDPKTSLPIKRIVRQPQMAIAVTETYRRLVADGKLDAKTFELPRETSETIRER